MNEILHKITRFLHAILIFLLVLLLYWQFWEHQLIQPSRGSVCHRDRAVGQMGVVDKKMLPRAWTTTRLENQQVNRGHIA